MALLEEFEKQGNWLFRYRGVLPLIILAVGAFIYIRAELNPSPSSFMEVNSYKSIYEISCLLVSLFGLAIRVYTIGHTPSKTSGRNIKEQVAESLNTTGIYSVVRHPLYLGNFFMWLGPAMLTANFWFIVSFCLAYWIYYERIMFAEEQFLRRKFGEAYTEWASRVPAFIPCFKHFKKPCHSFCTRKVVAKEKNGLLVVFLIFCSFNVVGELVHKGKHHFNMIFIGMCILSIVLYIVVKIFRKKINLVKQ